MSLDKALVKKQILQLEEDQFRYFPSNYNSLLFFNYILHKHKGPLLLPSPRQVEKMKVGVASELFMHWSCDPKVGLRKLKVPDFYQSMIKLALYQKNTRFIAFPLILHDKYACNLPQTRDLSHMTLVLYDKKHKYIEIFDPAGATSKYEMQAVPVTLFNVLQNRFNLEIRGIVVPDRICIGSGIQLLQENEVYSNKLNVILGGNVGFCSIFAALYLDFRLQHPDKRPSEVVELIKSTANEQQLSLTKYIVEYLKTLQEYKLSIEHGIDSAVLEKMKAIEKYPSSNTTLTYTEKTSVIKQLLKVLNAKLR